MWVSRGFYILSPSCICSSLLLFAFSSHFLGRKVAITLKLMDLPIYKNDILIQSDTL